MLFTIGLLGSTHSTDCYFYTNNNDNRVLNPWGRRDRPTESHLSAHSKYNKDGGWLELNRRLYLDSIVSYRTVQSKGSCDVLRREGEATAECKWYSVAWIKQQQQRTQTEEEEPLAESRRVFALRSSRYLCKYMHSSFYSQHYATTTVLLLLLYSSLLDGTAMTHLFHLTTTSSHRHDLTRNNQISSQFPKKKSHLCVLRINCRPSKRWAPASEQSVEEH